MRDTTLVCLRTDKQALASLTGEAVKLSNLFKGVARISVHFMSIHTHSIMGEGEAIGIVPRFAQELFDRVEGMSDDEVTAEAVG